MKIFNHQSKCFPEILNIVKQNSDKHNNTLKSLVIKLFKVSFSIRFVLIISAQRKKKIF